MGVYSSMQCRLTALPYQADKRSVSANPVVSITVGEGFQKSKVLGNMV